MPFKKGNTVNLGRKQSPEERKMRSLAHKGLHPSTWGAGFKKGNIPWNRRNNIVSNAYYAGLVDGEGYICIQSNSPDKRRDGNPVYKRIAVRISMNTCKALEAGKNTYGGFIYKRNHSDKMNKKVHYEWILQYGFAEAFLKQIRPYIRDKVRQVEIALEYRRLQQRQKGLQKITDEEILYRNKLELELKSLHLDKGLHVSS